MAGCQPKREKGKREKGKQRGRMGRMGQSVGTFCDFLSFKLAEWHPNHEGWRDGATHVLCPPAIPCSCSQPWACGETRQTARLHLGRRPRPHVLTAKFVGSCAERRLKEVVSTPTMEGGWQLGLSNGRRDGQQSIVHHPAHAWQPETRLVGSARSLDQSWIHLGEPQQLPRSWSCCNL